MKPLQSRQLTNKQSGLLKEVAYVKIRDAILRGEFTPIEFLSESKLIDFLGMSKTPIKSAIDRLEAEGLVQVAPKQGIVVTELSLDKVRDIFDLRIALETFVSEQICGKINIEQQKEIEGNLTESENAVFHGDEKHFAEVDSEFHLLLSKCSGNAVLYKTLSNYQTLLFRIVLNVLHKDPNRMVNSHKDHVNIYEAILGNDAALARNLVKEHLNYGKYILLN